MLCESEGRRSSLALNIANVMYTSEGTPLYIPPLTCIVNKKIIKNPNEFSG